MHCSAVMAIGVVPSRVVVETKRKATVARSPPSKKKQKQKKDAVGTSCLFVLCVCFYYISNRCCVRSGNTSAHECAVT